MLDLLVFIFIFSMIFSKEHPKYVLSIYCGVPGSGKSTIAAKLADYALSEAPIITYCKDKEDRISRLIMRSGYFKRSQIVYSNLAIAGCRNLDPRVDLGTYLVENALVIIDEAGLDYNSRNFKSFPEENRRFFKFHRHEKCEVAVFSQTASDMDKVIRDLAHNIYIVENFISKKMFVAKKVRRRIGVDPQTSMLRDYDIKPVFLMDYTFCWGPSYWHLFNSHSRLELPEKEIGWEVYPQEEYQTNYDRYHENLHDSLIIIGIHPDSILLKDVDIKTLLKFRQKVKVGGENETETDGTEYFDGFTEQSSDGIDSE